MTSGTVATLIYHLFLIKLRKDDFVYRENEKADNLFIISKGQFIVSKCIPIQRHKTPFDQSIKYFHQSKFKKNYDVKIKLKKF